MRAHGGSRKREAEKNLKRKKKRDRIKNSQCPSEALAGLAEDEGLPGEYF